MYDVQKNYSLSSIQIINPFLCITASKINKIIIVIWSILCPTSLGIFFLSTIIKSIINANTKIEKTSTKILFEKTDVSKSGELIILLLLLFPAANNCLVLVKD